MPITDSPFLRLPLFVAHRLEPNVQEVGVLLGASRAVPMVGMGPPHKATFIWLLPMLLAVETGIWALWLQPDSRPCSGCQ